jgi:adenosylcobinamide kinase/adenosylcobinamide-phosphate guanylyltransferase
MVRIVLVTGGCRSGKSGYAQRLAESLPPTRLFVATCPVTDEEIQHRIQEHRRAREDHGWETVEEQCDLAGVFRRQRQYQVLLVDCVTLWINNLMYHAQREGRSLTEANVAEHCRQVLDAAEDCTGTVIFVTNEVGLGVVPENAQARRYRDLVGRANQVLAARSDTVTLLCCGIPMQVKGKETRS